MKKWAQKGKCWDEGKMKALYSNKQKQGWSHREYQISAEKNTYVSKVNELREYSNRLYNYRNPKTQFNIFIYKVNMSCKDFTFGTYVLCSQQTETQYV